MVGAGRRLGRRLDAVDPGALRRRRALRATLAALATWACMTGAGVVVTGGPQPGPALFGVVVTSVAALVVSDVARRSRLVSFASSATAALVTTSVAAWAGPRTAWAYALLLVLVFLSLAARRWGLRAGTVAMVAVMTGYFAVSTGARVEALSWYLLAAVLGFAWLALWQFVLLPYDPRAEVVRAGSSFFHRVEEGVAAVNAVLAGDRSPVGRQRTTRALRHVHLCRGVIDSQVPALMAPGAGTREATERLQQALTEAEQGVARMVDGLSGDEPPVPGTVAVLAELELALQEGRVDEMHASLVAGIGTPHGDLARGTYQVLRSAVDARAVLRSLDSLAPGAGSPFRHAPPVHSPAVAGRPPLPFVLGLQAVTATGASMLLGTLLGLDHIDWIFWTSFVVIAGSAGESVRRVILRVTGTVGGGAAAVAVLALAPDSLGVVVTTGLVGVFAALYVASVSYSLLAFWLTFAMGAVAERFGAPVTELVVERSAATLLGGAVAAFVVLTIFPVRVGDRFAALFTRYVEAVVDTLGAVGEAISDGERRPHAVRAAAVAAAQHDELDRAMSVAAWESNPFPRTTTTLGDQLAALAGVAGALGRVVRSLPDPGDLVDPGRRAELLHLVGQAQRQCVHLLTSVGAAPDRPPPHDRPPPPPLPPAPSPPSGDVLDAPRRALESLRDALLVADNTLAAARRLARPVPRTR